MYNNLYEGRHFGVLDNGFNSWFFSPAAIIGLSVIGFILAVWFMISIALKGYALWTAAKRHEKWWFIALLVINTMGILELIYLLFIAKVSFGRKSERCCEHCDSCKKDYDKEDSKESDDDGEEEMTSENKKHTRDEVEEVL